MVPWSHPEGKRREDLDDLRMAWNSWSIRSRLDTSTIFNCYSFFNVCPKQMPSGSTSPPSGSHRYAQPVCRCGRASHWPGRYMFRGCSSEPVPKPERLMIIWWWSDIPLIPHNIPTISQQYPINIPLILHKCPINIPLISRSSKWWFVDHFALLHNQRNKISLQASRTLLTIHIHPAENDLFEKKERKRNKLYNVINCNSLFSWDFILV